MSLSRRYWLPGVSDHSAAGDTGREYRVLGVDARTSVAGLNRNEALNACLDAGASGLAAPTSASAKQALDDVIQNALKHDEPRREAVAAQAACAAGRQFAVIPDVEPKCKEFCHITTRFPDKFSFFRQQVDSVDVCGELCSSIPECQCAFFTFSTVANKRDQFCYLKAWACDSEELRMYDDGSDEHSHDAVFPCKEEHCCTHRWQRQFWVAGLRTGFDEPDCQGPGTNNGVWPYFDAVSNDSNGQPRLDRFNNCGQDRLRNWAWQVGSRRGPLNANETSELVRWGTLQYAADMFWEPEGLVPAGGPQPSGWLGFYETGGEEPGYYQNCTAARMYMEGDHSGIDLALGAIAGGPHGVAFWNDLSCSEVVLDRWVCEYEPSGGGGGGAVGVAKVVGGAVSAFVALVVLAVLAVVWARRAKRARESAKPSYPASGPNGLGSAGAGKDAPAAHATTGTAASGQFLTWRNDPEQIRTVQLAVKGEAGLGDALQEAHLHTTVAAGRTGEAARARALRPAGPGARRVNTRNRSVMKMEVHRLLDSFGAEDAFYGPLRLQPDMPRREGGQGVVAFALDVVTRQQYAVKVFGLREHFDAETAMYTNEALGHVLPQIRDAVTNEDGALVAPCGLIVPPFIVLNRGQPFDEWCRRAKPDFASSLQVLMHIGEKLQAMHAAGYAHRDVKPSNVIWTEAINRWELIDFASAGAIGEPAAITFTIMYAAPEVIKATAARRSHTAVDGAVDVWALGMMAWSMLVGESPWADLLEAQAACGGAGRLTDLMVRQLLGRTAFPWERGTLPDGTKRCLGIMRPTILAMLRRNPAERPTMQRLMDSWTGLFQSSETFASNPCTVSLASDHGPASPASLDATSTSHAAATSSQSSAPYSYAARAVSPMDDTVGATQGSVVTALLATTSAPPQEALLTIGNATAFHTAGGPAPLQFTLGALDDALQDDATQESNEVISMPDVELGSTTVVTVDDSRR